MTPLKLSILGLLPLAISACQSIRQTMNQAMEFEGALMAKEGLAGEVSHRDDDAMIRNIRIKNIELPEETSTYFAVVAGGGAPSYNEVALEKNVLYFQRSLTELGFSPEIATLFFASGNPFEATVRYLDDHGEEQFRAANIPALDGGATLENTYSWFKAITETEKPCPAFFYFTGHGIYNGENEDNNSLILWKETLVSVTAFTHWLKPLPADQPFVTMMAQCYSGSFANMIYENGDPTQPVALQTRCGFFATVASRPSVGCTPAVNEADYKDYSSSFFAGLTGRDRVGNTVPSADYNTDGNISYAEAHAFAKVDEETTDWPISTVEAWLQRQVDRQDMEIILATPLEELREIARPEQQHVVTSLAALTGFDLTESYSRNQTRTRTPASNTVEEAYQVRLEMELINIGAESKVRASQVAEQIAILDKIMTCEAGIPSPEIETTAAQTIGL